MMSLAAFGGLALAVDQVLPLMAYCWVAAIGIVLGIVDIAVHRLPGRLTVLLVIGAGTILALHALTSGTLNRLIEASLTGVGAAIFYLVLSLATRGGIGLGDAKLAPGLAFTAGWTAWTAAVFAVILGLVLTGLAAIGLIVFAHAGRKDSLPHGPFMVLATVMTVVLTHL